MIIGKPHEGTAYEIWVCLHGVSWLLATRDEYEAAKVFFLSLESDMHDLVVVRQVNTKALDTSEWS